MPLKRTIQPLSMTADPASRKFMADVAENFDARRTSVTISASAESANVVTLTMQVRDRLNREPIAGRWLLMLWISATATGVPAGTQTVAVSTGTLIQNSGDQIVTLATDSTGTAVVTITIAGDATRHVSVANLEEIADSGVLTWTA